MAAASTNMTEGPVRPHLLRMAGFIGVSMLMQTLYGLVDLYWVGHLGQQAIAAVAVAGNLIFVVLAGTQALSVGTVALVAQAMGRGDLEAVRLNTAQATSLSLAGGGLALIAGFAGMQTYANAVAADATTARLAVEYLAWFLPSFALQFLMTAQISALRGIGNMKISFVTQTGSVLLNMVLAPLFIFGWAGFPQMGVAGAGLATLLSVLAATAYLGAQLARGQGPLRFPLAELKPRFEVWARIMTIGLPAAGEFLLMSAYLALIYTLASRFGPDAQAGLGIGMRMLQGFFMVPLSLSFATAAIVGQNYGARRPERVREAFREAALTGSMVMLALMMVMHFAPGALVRLFSSEPDVVAAGAEFLRIISWNLVTTALIMACGGVFQGLGNIFPSLFASAARMGLTFIFALWAASLAGFALWQLWVLSVFTTTVQAVLCLWFLRREFRRRLGPMEAGEAAPAAA